MVLDGKKPSRVLFCFAGIFEKQWIICEKLRDARDPYLILLWSEYRPHWVGDQTTSVGYFNIHPWTVHEWLCSGFTEMV